jgi:hypothetical protein
MKGAPPGKKGAKKGAKKKESDDPHEVVMAFQKHYVRLARERGQDPLKLGPSDENGALSTEHTFAKVVLSPHMPGPSCELPQFVTLLDALAFYKHLRHLCIWRIPLGDDGCTRLARFLRSSKTVTRLEIFDCAVGPEGCAQIAKALQTNTVLARLALDHNHIRDEGIEALASALEHNAALQSLSLSFCGATTDGAEACARLIRTCHLKDLELHGNDLKALGAARCIEALKENATLLRLGLACTSWGGEGVVTAALLNTMDANKTCNEYNIDGNPIGDANALLFAAKLAALPHVTGLITTDQLSSSVFHQIAKLTDANRKEWVKRMKKGRKGRKKGGKKKAK